MDTSRIPYYAFILSLWITLHVAADKAPAPKNVSLVCHNMKNTLSWEHDEAGPGLSFQVVVSSLQSNRVTLEVNWPDMSIDLSKYSNPTDDYFVRVFAVKDGDIATKSEKGPSLRYSYFQDSLATVKCGLDLPTVDVKTLEENRLSFNFTHPGVLYLPQATTTRKRRNHQSQTTLPIFEYHIEILDQVGTYDYSCTEPECQETLHVDSSEKSYCLNINGEMEKMSVRATREYCSKPLKAPGTNPLAFVIPILLVLVGVGIIGAMWFVRKTRPRTSRPRALDVAVMNHPQRDPALYEYSHVSVDVGHSSPEPLLSSEQDVANSSGGFADEVRRPLGVPEVQNEDEQQGPAGAQGASEDGYTPGTDLDGNEDEPGAGQGNEDEEEPGVGREDEYEEEPSAYEKREHHGPKQDQSHS